MKKMTITHIHLSDIGGETQHTFDVKDAKKSITVREEHKVPEEWEAWTYAGEYENPPVAGHTKKYTATGKVYKVTYEVVVCPICGDEIEHKEIKRELVRTYQAEDLRLL